MKLYQVDAFTDTPFAGNPAGVCILDELKPDAWMTSVAREMNLSETAFLRQNGSGYDLRWFTPTTEVSLCGHASLASAHIIWQERLAAETQSISFSTKSGLLLARKAADAIEMDFPARSVQSRDGNRDLNRSLGITPSFTGSFAGPKGEIFLLQVGTDREVKGIVPDYQLLRSTSARAVIVTSPSSDPAYDFVSRYFAPAVGIDEDPVTGSAHCYLAPFWSARLGKQRLTGYQASQRTGMVTCTFLGDRVLLAGKAVTVFRAELLV